MRISGLSPLITPVGTTPVTEYTGSIGIGNATSVRISATPVSVPSVTFSITLQLQQSANNISFSDVGSSLVLSSAAAGALQVNVVGGCIVRLKLTFTASTGSASAAVVQIDVDAVQAFLVPEALIAPDFRIVSTTNAMAFVRREATRVVSGRPTQQGGSPLEP